MSVIYSTLVIDSYRSWAQSCDLIFMVLSFCGKLPNKTYGNVTILCCEPTGEYIT